MSAFLASGGASLRESKVGLVAREGFAGMREFRLRAIRQRFGD